MDLSVKWNGKMAFTGVTLTGHNVVMDADKDVGGENGGARPTEMLLNAVAGCTGMDIISILQKMRLQPIKFEMNVEGQKAESHPKKFTAIHIHYELEGELPEKKVVQAIQLSKNNYCSVAHSLSTNITVSYAINGIEGRKAI